MDSEGVDPDSSATVNFALQPTTIELAQVVVLGYYGAKRRAEVTNAVRSVTADEFNDGAARDAASLIAGKIPGLSVSTPSEDSTRSTEIMENRLQRMHVKLTFTPIDRLQRSPAFARVSTSFPERRAR